jgi:ATP-dependent RNA/DNA helicase IGHMBP2
MKQHKLWKFRGMYDDLMLVLNTFCLCMHIFKSFFVGKLSWIPILRGKRVVLAGDHCQLPPTIKSNNHEVQKALSRTMFERIMDYRDVSRMLRIQYRMHEDISNWASEAMYNGQLLTHELVKGRKLIDLAHVSENYDGSDTMETLLSTTQSATLMLIDTAGCDMFESVNASGSRYNDGEAKLVQRHVEHLLKIGLKEKDIAIITPYNGQVEILKKLLLVDFPALEIRSVDGFQVWIYAGRLFEAI